MPNNRIQTVYLTTGNPDTVNDAALYKGGELGAEFDFAGNKRYQLVQLDSGATASTPSGVVAANQLAFWKDKSKYLVTNDQRQAIGNSVANAWRNEVAGIFRNAATGGNYCCVLKRGSSIPVKSDGTGGIGQIAMANSGANADVTPNAVGVASIYLPVGVMVSAPAGGNVNVDVNIPNVE
jgi:hypothetical protein